MENETVDKEALRKLLGDGGGEVILEADIVLDLLSECSRLASRVEELERALKIASCQLAQGPNMDFSDANLVRWQEGAQRIKQQLLIEAREDLAKHSGSLNSTDSASNTVSDPMAREIRRS